ncbi:MAG: hypothetical protein H6Q68_3598 [Firmicutes bacterium]|nr:hypothetical protein [Bacillota bacterium]
MELSKIGQTALYYAGMGWHVIPLAENSKFLPKIKPPLTQILSVNGGLNGPMLISVLQQVKSQGSLSLT